MKTSFEVSRVFEDGTETEPLIVPVGALPADVHMARRVFFRAGITLSGAAALLSGCGAPDRTGSTAATPLPEGKRPDPLTAPAPARTPEAAPPPVAKKTVPRRERPRPAPSPDADDVPVGNKAGKKGGGTRFGDTIERPCTPEPVPAGYVCTCNCVAR